MAVGRHIYALPRRLGVSTTRCPGPCGCIRPDARPMRARRYRAYPLRPPPFAGEGPCCLLSIASFGAQSGVPAGRPRVRCRGVRRLGHGALYHRSIFRTAADAKSRPSRALGLAWVGMIRRAQLPMSFEARRTAADPPRRGAAIRLRNRPRRLVRLAAVSEGILRLTKFASPRSVRSDIARGTPGCPNQPLSRKAFDPALTASAGPAAAASQKATVIPLFLASVRAERA